MKRIKDERLAPMTYKKLREMGWNENKWKNLTQEQANEIIAQWNKKAKKIRPTPKQREQRQLPVSQVTTPPKGKFPVNYKGVMGSIFTQGYGVALVDDKALERDKHLNGTLSMYYKDGEWTTERLAVHKKIIDDIFKNKPKHNRRGKFYMLAGGAASEKEKIPFDVSDKIIFNPGLLKKRFPEWNPQRPFTVYEEASAVARQILMLAITNGFDVVDTGSQDEGFNITSSKLTQAKEYEADSTHYLVAFNSVKNALKANAQRKQVTERENLIESHKTVEKVSKKIKNEFDTFAMYDTNGDEARILK